MKRLCLLFSCGVVLSFRWRTWCWKLSRRPRSATWRRMIWRLKTSSSVLFGPLRSNSSRNWITCWTLSAAWRNRTKNCASLLCLLLFLLPLLRKSLFFIRLTKLVFDCRERQDADGQMKELQDQLEAEQYFSVSVFSFFFFLHMTWKRLASTHCAFKIFLLKMHAVYSCQNNIPFLLIAKSSVK